MYTEHRNHEQALLDDAHRPDRRGPAELGAWVAYGLGTENQNLPAYVVLPDPSGLPVDGIRNWSSGWLPPLYQGTPFRSEGMPVLNLQPQDAAARRGRAGPAASCSATLNAEHQAAPARRAGARRPHRQLRAGGADAALGDRRARPRRRRRRDHAAAVRPRQAGHAVLRHALPDGPAAGRARRPLRADLHGRPAVGHAHQQHGRHPQLLRADRPARSPAC